jgi:hypothetical protein
LTWLHLLLLVFASGVPTVVLAPPLGALIVPLYLGDVDEAITDSPFRRARVSLIVSNSL